MGTLPPRLQRLTDSLDDLALDAMLITDEINVRYLSGFTGDSSILVGEHRKEATILSDGRYTRHRLPSSVWGSIHRSVAQPSCCGMWFKEVISWLPGAKRVGIEADKVTLAEYQFLEVGM